MTPIIDFLSGHELRVADLEAIYVACCGHADFRRSVISAIDQLEPAEMWRPIWLLRRSLRGGAALASDDLQRIIERADGFDHWIARLNFCQMMSEANLPKSAIEDVYPLLEEFAEDRRTIIRAWAISALFPFRKHEIYGSRIRGLLARAKRERSKSMQARLRRLEQSEINHRANVEAF